MVRRLLVAVASLVAEHRLQGAPPSVVVAMWGLPRAGIEPVSSALTGRFLTPDPPGKSLDYSGLIFPARSRSFPGGRLCWFLTWPASAVQSCGPLCPDFLGCLSCLTPVKCDRGTVPSSSRELRIFCTGWFAILYK